MTLSKDFEKRIFGFSNNAEFEDLAFSLFRYQYRQNELYKNYVQSLHIDPENIRSVHDIPFLPIGLFRSHRVTTGDWEPELVFESSGTTQTVNSRHYIKSAALYRESFLHAFRLFYGPVEDYAVIGLLPSYLERQHSSLVYMVNELIHMSGHPESGFYLYEHEALHYRLSELEQREQPALLIGVTFALLDFAEAYAMQLRHTIVMETGGMKGRRTELTRPEVHQLLKERLGVAQVHAEYGMTELLSQAYAERDGIFQCPPWMRVFLRDESDPLHTFGAEQPLPANGVINVIDLANIHSCAFLATEDIGRLHDNGRFEVLGRTDNSALRGCSLMVS